MKIAPDNGLLQAFRYLKRAQRAIVLFDKDDIDAEIAATLNPGTRVDLCPTMRFFLWVGLACLGVYIVAMMVAGFIGTIIGQTIFNTEAVVGALPIFGVIIACMVGMVLVVAILFFGVIGLANFIGETTSFRLKMPKLAMKPVGETRMLPVIKEWMHAQHDRFCLHMEVAGTTSN